MKSTRRKMNLNDLSVLPFEKILSYLSLEDLIRSRAVSRRWRKWIDSFKLKSLFYSKCLSGFIEERNRWVSGAFAQNFISSRKFEAFFKIFGKTILSNLKHLRLYAIDVHAGSQTAFTRALNSLDQLEELDLICEWNLRGNNKRRRQLKLNLPMLKFIQFKEVRGIGKLTLNAPRLRKVKISWCSLRLDLVHSESVEWLAIHCRLSCLEMKSLKNLKYLYVGPFIKIDFPFILGLGQLKEIHLISEDDVSELFELKQRYGRTDLKVYRLGCLLDGPDDPVILYDFDLFNGENFVYLAANPSRMADEIPFWPGLDYTAIEHLTPESQALIVNRLTGMPRMRLDRPVQDIERFLNFLKTFNQIAGLIVLSNQPQEQFDRLPECCGLQELAFFITPLDYEFLFRLKSLVSLVIRRIDIQTIRRALEELELLEYFQFKYLGTSRFRCKICIRSSKGFKLYTLYLRGKKKVSTRDQNVVTQFIIQQNTTEEQDRMEVN